MREIIFRGKRLDNGKWVNGMICQYHEGISAKIIHNTFGAYEDGMAYCVDPSTIGQYTGLTDKTGRRIFEGDILRRKVKYPGEIPKHIVEWEDKSLMFVLRQCGKKSYTDFTIMKGVEWEIIGNVHDNREILRGP